MFSIYDKNIICKDFEMFKKKVTSPLPMNVTEMLRIIQKKYA